MPQSKPPLDLPEIQTAVAQYLGNASLAAAATVSKDWNASCSPFLYQNVAFDNSPSNGADNYAGILTNAVLVRELTLQKSQRLENLPSFLFINGDENKGLIFTRLRKLSLQLSYDEPSDWCGVMELVRRNPGLEELTVHSRLPTMVIRALSESCLCLASLSLWFLKLDREGMMLLRMCTGGSLVSLTLMFVDSTEDCPGIQVQECTSTLTQNSRLQHLKFIGHRGLSLQGQLDWAQRCPQLKSLALSVQDNQNLVFPTMQLCEALSTTLLLIEDLDLDHERLSEDDLVRIMESCGPGPRIKSLRLRKALFGAFFWPRALKSMLNHHVSVLTSLGMGLCTTFTSEMVQHVMTTCPHLRFIQAKYLRASDILHATSEGASSSSIPSWICTQLRRLEVHIDGFTSKPPHWNHLVLKQLSTLNVLESLDITLYEYDWYDEDYRTSNSLDLRLEAGLGALANLKRLKRLSFSRELQRVGEKELEWMRRTWPRFEPDSL